MLTALKIQNLILIEQATLSLGPGLTILTGETGAGKSAILTAIRWISGERAETQMIRKGADFAIVEAIVDGAIIRREIHRSGKNRCFIDDQQVGLSALRAQVAIERVDQSSSLELTSMERQLHLLDTFAGLLAEVATFHISDAEEKKIGAELEALRAAQQQREREIEWALKDLSLIEEVDWRLGEEETLSQEHHLLTHGQELLEKVGTISSTLTEGQEPLLPALKRIAASLEQCLRLDGGLSPVAQAMKSAVLELEEIGRLIRSYVDRLEVDPQRLLEVEKRIAAIEGLKRRFGPDIEAQKKKLQHTLDQNLDTQIESLQLALAALKKKNSLWAEEIDQKRKKAALIFAAQILVELKSLNIPHAQFTITDAFRFLFSANPGVAPIPLEECASGGELSRLLLAIKILLSEGSSCLVFDEIDSNVGGQTAAILGEKIKRLSEKRQVICVTHFVQVAKCAMEHFLVSKIETDGQAYTTIKKLGETEREKEYHRMLGQKP